MAVAPQERVRKRPVWFSPFLLVVALSPVLLQTGTPLSCSGDARLAVLEINVDGVNELVFDSDQHFYSLSLPAISSNTALVRAFPIEPTALVSVIVQSGSQSFTGMWREPGGGEDIIPLAPGLNSLRVFVTASGGASSSYNVGIEVGCVDCDDGNECTTDACDPVLEMCTHTPVADDTACDFGGEFGTCVSGMCEMGFPCTEQGILDAIALGGGPHTFVCNSPTTVTTEGEIFIYNDVILDGEGNLTVDAGGLHRVLSVSAGVTAELVGITVTGGPGTVDGAGIFNEGTLMVTDSSVVWNGSPEQQPNGAGIYSSGTLTLIRSRVSENASYFGASAIYSVGALVLIDSVVSDNFQTDDGLITSIGTMTLIRSAVTGNELVQGWAIWSSGITTLINSTVSENVSCHNSGIAHSGGTLTLLNSTIVSGPSPCDSGDDSESVISATDMVVTNSVIVDTPGPGPLGACYGSGTVTSGGGNIESTGDTCGLTDPTDLVNVTAAMLNLGPLADNGGPTETHALLPGSVAIDRIPAAMCLDENGDPLATDQRGVARPQGAMCDVGAFEWADCSGTPCDDGNDCTADYCDPLGYSPLGYSWCVNNALPDGTLCDFAATGDGVCVDGACASCPVLTSVLVTPLQANVGDQINVSAEASGVGPINYLWTATGGSFVDPSLPITAYRCEEPGQQDLTITISDGTGSCMDQSTVPVTCVVGGSPPP